mgnify:CR=1 FL=1
MSNLIAQELDIKEIIIPPYSGNFSAWGLLGADLLQMNARTKILRLSDESIQECNSILDELFSELQKRQKIDFDTSKNIKDIALDMRWMGQEHTITLKLDTEQDGKINLKADQIKELFMTEYLRTFGSKLDTVIEIVSTRASLRVPLPRKVETGNIQEEAIEISNNTIIGDGSSNITGFKTITNLSSLVQTNISDISDLSGIVAGLQTNTLIEARTISGGTLKSDSIQINNNNRTGVTSITGNHKNSRKNFTGIKLKK